MLKRVRMIIGIVLLLPVITILLTLTLISPEARVSLLENRAVAGGSLQRLEFIGASEILLFPSPKLSAQNVLIELPPSPEGPARRLTFKDLKVESSWLKFLRDRDFRLTARQLVFEARYHDSVPKKNRSTLDSVLNKLEFNALSFDQSFKNGVSLVPNFESRLLGGQLSNALSINTKSNPRIILTQGQLDQANVSEVLTLLGTRVVPTGFIDLEWNVALEREHDSTSPPQVFGEASFSGLEIGLSQINLELELCNAFNRARGKPITPSNSFGTLINSLKVTQNIDGYRTDITSLQVALPGLDIGGSGTIDRLSQTFEANLVARIGDKFATSVENCTLDTRLKAIDWPIHCEGSLVEDDPRSWCSVELETLLRRGLESELKRRLNDEGVESVLRSLIPGRP